MSDLICVTNRKICKGDFLTRIEEIARAEVKSIILREKDLDEDAYTALARQVMVICKKYETPCILHSYVGVASTLGADRIHLPLHMLRKMTDREKSRFSVIGASCHSIEEAKEAEERGCTYITAGHVFDTECKKGLPGRGLAFLREICESVSVPVYAIGGIDVSNYNTVRGTGAAGACIMSGFMQCGNVQKYMERYWAEHEI